MAAPRNTRTTHPARSPQTEAMLKDRSIAFEFEPNLAVSEIREADGYQVRLTKNRAPKEQVAKYSTAMKHGATFPAVVLNENYELIDGNTRLQARLRNSGETIAAYILFGVTALDARSLSVELNQSNGLQMNDEEIYGFIANAVKDGQQPEVRALARMTGVREPKITRWIAEIHFLERAAQMGIAERHLNALPASTRAALQATRLEAVFEEITTLAAEAKLPTAFVKKMVGQVNGAPSEQAALELISTERAQRVDEIRAVASGFSPRDRASKGSAQHLGGLQRFDVDALLDVAPEKQFETFKRMKILRDRLDTAVARAANEWDLTPPAEPAADDDETPVAERPRRPEVLTMAPPISAAAGVKHAAQRDHTEDILNARHVSFRFEANLALDQLRDVEGNQVRRSEHRAPKDMVERYAEQMKNGATFPAIVVNENYGLVDGNTRWAATRIIKRSTIAAYVCENLTALEARSLSVELNQVHGQSMSTDEIRAFVEGAADAGQKIDPKSYARMTGAKPRKIGQWVAAHAFRSRAVSEGFSDDVVAVLPEQVQIALNSLGLKAVFVEMTRLAVDARINAKDASEVVRDANAATSESEALAAIAAARTARAEEIRALAAGFRPPKRKSTMAAPHLVGLLRFTPADLIDVAPDRQQAALSRMRTLHEQLGEAITLAQTNWAPSADAGTEPA